ncbi:uncharacterized protein [Procambarus clarkii]|uniref:uncharacterized protein isoform X2 n=1 Tax=Procambarus clarkii TaxID=6728 RepID=UPI001E671FAA|nr:uncharacterized protein LOC123745333 isoform X2 [Procambarus clarkii]
MAKNYEKMLTYEDSDDDSNSDSFPCLGDEYGHGSGSSKPTRTDVESLRNAERSDTRYYDHLEKLAEELKLFDIKENESLQMEPLVDVKESQRKRLSLQPPGVPFFTGRHHHRYSEETLIWPFQEKALENFAKLDQSKVKKYIYEGLFQREFSSKSTVKLLMQYLFHTMCCTTDVKLLYSTYNTLCYLWVANHSEINICQDLYFALDNIGADVSKLLEDVSEFKSPVIIPTYFDSSDEDIPFSSFKETITLILQLLSVILMKSNKYNDDDVDFLIGVLFAIGLDPKIIDSGIDHHISTCIANTLNLYSSDQVFYQVEDVVKLVEEQLDVLHNEEDANVLHSVMKLLDCCITHEPLRAAQKKHLKKLCELISPIVTNVRDKGDDLNPTVFRFYAQQVIKKWGWKVVMIGRQQTLDEFHVTSPQKTEDTSH